MTSLPNEPYLKYAIFCRGTDEGSEGELILNDVVDLIDLPKLPKSVENAPLVLAEIDLNLAFCIAGAEPGPHHLMVAIKGPGMPLAPPPTQARAPPPPCLVGELAAANSSLLVLSSTTTQFLAPSCAL